MNREILARELHRDEGEVLHAYQDSRGFWTLGIGRLIDKSMGGGITHDEALFLLENDIAKVEADLDRELPWWRALDEVRQRVLANMAFNLGIRKLLGFKNTLAAVQRGDYEAAAKGMLKSLWAKQVGQRAERLAAMMRTGRAA
jgi:lysozyme